ncbi:MAG: cob(I)yrinic acid a,c-diamide adenosyltransferase [Roseimicrobium sp.]
MSITTRRGDNGETDLLFGCRVQKNYPRIETIGCVDELNAALGLVCVSATHAITQREVPQMQETLIALMGELATPVGQEERYAQTHPHRVNTESIDHLDFLVHELEAAGALKFKGWALPGAAGSLSGAHCDVARTVCRRAERAVVALKGMPEAVPNGAIVRYLNRLSDVLWLLARIEEKSEPCEQG